MKYKLSFAFLLLITRSQLLHASLPAQLQFNLATLQKTLTAAITQKKMYKGAKTKMLAAQKILKDFINTLNTGNAA